MTLTFIKGQFLGLSSPCCPYVRKNSLPIAIRFFGCGHGSVYGSGFMETMIQIKTQSENVCITDADPHTDVRTLWKRSFHKVRIRVRVRNYVRGYVCKF